MLDLPRSVSPDFNTAIATRVVRLTTASWEGWFAHLEQYVKTEGDARVPSSYTTLTGDKLGGRWVVAQRVAHTGRRGQLSAERRQRLEALSGWVWDLDDAIWEEWFSRLQQYVKSNGHARMPAEHTSPDGENLGRWVINDRSTCRHAPLPMRGSRQTASGSHSTRATTRTISKSGTWSARHCNG